MLATNLEIHTDLSSILNYILLTAYICCVVPSILSYILLTIYVCYVVLDFQVPFIVVHDTYHVFVFTNIVLVRITAMIAW